MILNTNKERSPEYTVGNSTRCVELEELSAGSWRVRVVTIQPDGHGYVPDGDSVSGLKKSHAREAFEDLSQCLAAESAQEVLRSIRI